MSQLKRNFNMVVIGENYLSYLFGIRQQQLNNSTLIINDNGKNELSPFLNNEVLTIVEKSFLSYWGERDSIDALINIDKYLIKKNILCITDNMKIALGQSPSQNLLEIGRKLPSLFDKKIFDVENWSDSFREEFDNILSNLAHRIGDHASRNPKEQSYNIKSLLLHAPFKLTKMFKHFCSVMIDGQKQDVLSQDFLEYRNLLFLLRAHHQKVLSNHFSEFQLFYLFLSLLSPCYELNEEALSRDLKSYFEKIGGIFKKTKINDLRFSKSRPKRVELESFEGVIGPKKISFTSKIDKSYHLEIDNKSSLYSIVEVSYPFNSHSLFYNEDTIILLTLKEWPGTQFPMLKAKVFENRIDFQIFYKKEKAQKLSFIKERANKLLKDLISSKLDYLGLDINQELSWSLLPTEIIEISLKDNSNLKKSHLVIPKIPVIREKTPLNSSKPIKDTYYFGPALTSQLGSLSTLINISHYTC